MSVLTVFLDWPGRWVGVIIVSRLMTLRQRFWANCFPYWHVDVQWILIVF